MLTVNRGYRAVERQWLSEYLAQLYPDARPILEKRLHYEHPSAIVRGPGGSATGTEGRAIARLDGWLELADEIHVWEAAQWFHAGKLGQVIHYRDLLPRSYEGKHEVHKPVRWFALTSHSRREIAEACKAANIEYHVYLPEWLRQHQIEIEALGAARRRQFQEQAATAQESAVSASGTSPEASSDQNIPTTTPVSGGDTSDS